MRELLAAGLDLPREPCSASLLAPRSIETWRESHILQVSKRFEALTHGVNHVFCEVLSYSQHGNLAWITDFARFAALQALKHGVNHVFC